MNWEAIGAVGEILGAIAVVATLLYLARQTAENSRAVKAGAAREVTIAEAQWHGEIAQNPELMRIFAKSLKAPMESYTDEEWTAFRMLAMRSFLQFEMRHVDRNLQTGYEDQSSSRLSIAKGIVSTFPAWRRFWEIESGNQGFSQDFVDAVNAASSEAQMSHMNKGVESRDA